MPPEAINQKTERLLEKIGGRAFFRDFYLAGGTALSLQLGHRKSIDLDWFSGRPFSPRALKEQLADLGDFELTGEEEGTVHGLLDGVKVSFFHYGYPLLFKTISRGKIKLADRRDIAAMKIDAISSRGSKKDFIDLYFLMKEYGLPALIGLFEKKYKNIKYNKLHILKSLSYFGDAETDPLPVMLRPVKWPEVKKFIADKVLYGLYGRTNYTT